MSEEPSHDSQVTQPPVAPGGRTEVEVIRTTEGQWGAKGSGDTSGFGGLAQTWTMPAASSRPFGSWFDDVVDILLELIEAEGLNPNDVIEKVVVDRGQLTIFVVREHLPLVARMLRDDQDLRFEMCLGTSTVHYPGDKGRELHAYTALHSITHNRALGLESTCPDADPHIPTITPVYPGNDWHEREAWDLMGIVFDGHPGLTRTAMPDDWVGHPQRKDYPLGGIPVEYKGAVIPPPDTRRDYS